MYEQANGHFPEEDAVVIFFPKFIMIILLTTGIDAN